MLWRGLAVGAVVSVAATACSSSKSTSTTATTASASATTAAAAAPASTAPAPTKSPITIGILAQQTGPVAGGQAYVASAAKAWAAWVNSQGGINGHPVQIHAEDTTADAAAAEAAAQKLINDPSVVMISEYDSTTEASIAKLLSGSGVAITGQGFDLTSWGADIRGHAAIIPALPNFFTTDAVVSPIVDTQAAAAKTAGLTKMAVATCAEVAACAQAEPLYSAAAKDAGIAYDGLVKVASAAPNYTAECVKIVADGVDFFQMSTSADVGLRIVKDCQAQNYKGWYGASGPTADGTLVPSGVNWAGGIDGFPWWSDNAAVANFRKVMEAAKVTYQTPAVTSMWAHLELFRKALSNAGDTVSRSDVLAAFNSISNENLGGLLAQPVTFTAGKTAPPIECVWLYKLENGKFTSPEGDLKPHCFTGTPPKS